MSNSFSTEEFFGEEDLRAAAAAGPGHQRKSRRTNGHDPDGLLRLVTYEAMQPRLGDGYLVKHLLGSTSMTVLYGESGSGKTFFALHLGLNIAAGFGMLGRRVRQVGVVYVAAEAGRGIENRVAAARLTMAFPERIPFAVITSPIDLCTATADTDKLIATIKGADLERPVELIFIDTLSRVMAGGNENQPDHMGALVRNLDRLRAETGAAVVLVHHTGKDTSRGARGHSLLRAATDTEIEITRDDATKICTARVTKQREYATEGTLAFTLTQVDLGTDQDGDPVTSCVVEPSDSIPETRKTYRLSNAARNALGTLRKAIDEIGEPAPTGNHIPGSARVVHVEKWRPYHYAGTASEDRTPDARKKKFQRDRETLQAAKAVGCHNDLYWIAAGDV